VSRVSDFGTLSKELSSDSILGDLAPYIELEISYWTGYTISCEKYEKYVSDSWLDRERVTLIVDDPLGFFHEYYLCFLHFSEQYITLSQTFFHFLRFEKDL
jgi:hypothetical protein